MSLEQIQQIAVRQAASIWMANGEWDEACPRPFLGESLYWLELERNGKERFACKSWSSLISSSQVSFDYAVLAQEDMRIEPLTKYIYIHLIRR